MILCMILALHVITPQTDTMLVLTDHTNLSVYFVKPG